MKSKNLRKLIVLNRTRGALNLDWDKFKNFGFGRLLAAVSFSGIEKVFISKFSDRRARMTVSKTIEVDKGLAGQTYGFCMDGHLIGVLFALSSRVFDLTAAQSGTCLFRT